jgi:hypothetical protein
VASVTGFGIYAASIGDGKRRRAERRLVHYLEALTPSKQQRFSITAQGSGKDVDRVLIPAGGGVDFVPRHGCSAVASVALFGSVANADIRLNSAAQILHRLESTTFSRQEVVAAEARWSACARDALGMQAGSEGSLAAWVQSQYNRRGLNKQTRAVERRAALTNVRCAYSSGLAGAYARGIWTAALQMPRAWFLDLEIAMRWDAEATARARALLAGPLPRLGSRSETASYSSLDDRFSGA